VSRASTGNCGYCLTYSAVLGLFLTLSGCFSPIALHRAVIAYDRTSAQVQAEMLLLNIARAKHAEPLHFTAVSSVAATFNFESTAGIVPGAAGLTGTIVAPVFTTTVAENPTITIIPLQGAEYAQRILTPITAKKMLALNQEGVELGMVLRLFA